MIGGCIIIGVGIIGGVIARVTAAIAGYRPALEPVPIKR
jgi:hypothetical protein